MFDFKKFFGSVSMNSRNWWMVLWAGWCIPWDYGDWKVKNPWSVFLVLKQCWTRLFRGNDFLVLCASTEWFIASFKWRTLNLRVVQRWLIDDDDDDLTTCHRWRPTLSSYVCVRLCLNCTGDLCLNSWLFWIRKYYQVVLNFLHDLSMVKFVMLFKV